MASRQNTHSPTFSCDVRSSTAVITPSMSLGALLASPSNVIIGNEQTNSHRHSSPSASRHHQHPLTVFSSVPHLSTGSNGQSNHHHSTVFMPATEVRSLVLSQPPKANDGVLGSITPESHMFCFKSSPFNSPTTSSPLEQALDQTSSLTALLEALEREQLQDIHAKGGFAGFTAQEIECWVAAGRA